jgi:hypothetical protein
VGADSTNGAELQNNSKLLHPGLEYVNDDKLYGSRQAEVLLVRRKADRKVLVLKVYKPSNFKFYKNELHALTQIKVNGLYKVGFPLMYSYYENSERCEILMNYCGPNLKTADTMQSYSPI